MKLYTGDKPCPGCGKSGREESRWSVDSLCQDCKKAIRYGIEVIKQKQQQENDPVICLYFSVDFLNSRDFGSAIQEFLKTICLGNQPTNRTEYMGETPGWRSSYYIRESQFSAFKSMLDILWVVHKEKIAKAKADGQNLLISLHTGAITMERFNEHLNGK